MSVAAVIRAAVDDLVAGRDERRKWERALAVVGKYHDRDAPGTWPWSTTVRRGGSRRLAILVGTSALFALLSADDDNHEPAPATFERSAPEESSCSTQGLQTLS